MALEASKSSAAFILIGALLNLMVVAHGVAAVLHLPLAIASFAALLLIGLQLLAGRQIGGGNGLKLLLGFLAAYLALVSINVTLAAAGLSATFLAERLGRTSISRELEEPRAQVIAVSGSLATIAAAAQDAARTSAEKQALETSRGGSCRPHSCRMQQSRG
jgi:hypothetical protein